MADDSSPAPDKYEKRLADAVEYIRGNVRWTLIAFGAIGTTLLAGSQLSNLGKFETTEPRLWIALGFALLALGAAAYAVRAALAITDAGDTDIYRLEPADLALFEPNALPLEGFGTVANLRQAYEQCILARYQELTAAQPNIPVLQSYNVWFVYLDGLVDNVVSLIRYDRIRRQGGRSRSELTLASVVAAIGLVGFAWAANPKVEQRIVILKSPVSNARFTPTEAGRKALEPILGAKCLAAGSLDVIVLDPPKPELLSLQTKDCPLARFAMNDSLGALTSPAP